MDERDEKVHELAERLRPAEEERDFFCKQAGELKETNEALRRALSMRVVGRIDNTGILGRCNLHTHPTRPTFSHVSSPPPTATPTRTTPLSPTPLPYPSPLPLSPTPLPYPSSLPYPHLPSPPPPHLPPPVKRR